MNKYLGQYYPNIVRTSRQVRMWELFDSLNIEGSQACEVSNITTLDSLKPKQMMSYFLPSNQIGGNDKIEEQEKIEMNNYQMENKLRFLKTHRKLIMLELPVLVQDGSPKQQDNLAATHFSHSNLPDFD